MDNSNLKKTDYIKYKDPYRRSTSPSGDPPAPGGNSGNDTAFPFHTDPPRPQPERDYPPTPAPAPEPAPIYAPTPNPTPTGESGSPYGYGTAPQPQQARGSGSAITYVLLGISVVCLIAIAILCMKLYKEDRDHSSANPTETYLEVPTTAPQPTGEEAEPTAEEAEPITEETESTTAETEPPTTETEPVPTYPTNYPTYLVELNEKYEWYFDFIPDANGFVIADSSTRLISTEELFSMTEHQVCIARNEIYARHGYIFKTEKYTEYFSNFSWYVPTTTVLPQVQGIERANVEAIVAYEAARGWS